MRWASWKKGATCESEASERRSGLKGWKGSVKLTSIPFVTFLPPSLSHEGLIVDRHVPETVHALSHTSSTPSPSLLLIHSPSLFSSSPAENKVDRSQADMICSALRFEEEQVVKRLPVSHDSTSRALMSHAPWSVDSGSHD